MRLETNVTHPPISFPMALPTISTVLAVNENDPVSFLQESYGHGPGGTADHRYQVIFVPAGNIVSAFWTDLGPAEDFDMEVDGQTYRAPPYHHLVLSEHTVAECRFYAERDRMDDFAIQLLHTQLNESTLFADYRQIIEEDFERVANKSSFGPYQTTERNGYSPVGAQEQAYKLSERLN